MIQMRNLLAALLRLLILALLSSASCAWAATCSITGTGPIQADGTLGVGNPNLGDVYQIQGTTPSENYVDDDEANNGTVTFTSPNSVSVTVGMFLLNQSVNGTNTFAVRFAAGFQSKGTWVPGAWTWSMNYTDHQGTPYTCTATGSFTVASSWNAANGFLRQYSTTPNLYTDGQNTSTLFVPLGENSWNVPFASNLNIYGYADIPCAFNGTVTGGTTLTFNTGLYGCSSISTQTLPSGVTVGVYLCTSPLGTPPACTPYWNSTINSSTQITLSSSASNTTYVAVQGWVRDVHVGNRAVPYEVTLPNAAAFYAAFGETFARYLDGNSGNHNLLMSTYLGTGYNSYNWSTANSLTTPLFGIPSIDAWFPAAHAAGIHTSYTEYELSAICGSSYVCTSTTKANLLNMFTYISARWGAFVDVWEMTNEQANMPQTFVDYVGNLFATGATGYAGGNPADPYSHFYTTTYFPNNPSNYSPTYGPLGTNTDNLLTLIDLYHIDSASGQPPYEWFGDEATNTIRCPGNGTGGLRGNNWPAFQGEGAFPLGIAPATQSASTPNNEVNGIRIAAEQMAFNQCGNNFFNPLAGSMGINATTPTVAVSWFDEASASANVAAFMGKLDIGAVPLTVTMGGGCASNCANAFLGSSTRVRGTLVVSTGNSSTGVPSTVTNPSVTVTVPTGATNGTWVNPQTGATLASFTTTAGSQTLTYTGSIGGSASAPTDLWLALDPPAYTVTTSTAGTGSGTITASTSGSCAGGQNSGVTLSCVPNAATGSTFTGWSGTCGITGSSNPGTVTMPASNCTVIATFNAPGPIVNGGVIVSGTVGLN